MPATNNSSSTPATHTGSSRSITVIIAVAVVLGGVVGARTLMTTHHANATKAAVNAVAQGLKNAKEVTVNGDIYLFANGMEIVDDGSTRVYTGGAWYEKDSVAPQSGAGGPLRQWYKMSPCASGANYVNMGDTFFGPTAANDLSMTSHAGSRELAFDGSYNGTSYLQLTSDNHISAIVLSGLDTGPVTNSVSYNQPVSLPKITVASSTAYTGSCGWVLTPTPIGTGISGELRGVVNELSQ